MVSIYFNSAAPDDQRRRQLYEGDIHVFSAREGSVALTAWAREMIEEAFAPLDPLRAQHELDVYSFASILAQLKPRFIHHPQTKELMRQLVQDMGCDPDFTYLDVPRLRGVTSDGYLTSGPGYAFPMHRDTWWSAPLQQVNWWLPIYPIEADSAMAFHPAYWDTPVQNTSSVFDYYNWNVVGRAEAAKHVTSDSRIQPHIAQEPPPDPEPSLRFVTPPAGMVVFSAQHLHSTVPNVTGLTRYSIDFRTVNIIDVRSDFGAPNMDSAPRGTALRDFRRVNDNSAMPEDLARRVDPRDVDPAAAVYKPPAQMA